MLGNFGSRFACWIFPNPDDRDRPSRTSIQTFRPEKTSSARLIASNNRSSIGRNNAAQHGSVTGKRSDTLPVFYLPHPRRVISRSGDSSLAIGGDLHGIDQVRMILHQLVYSLIPPEVRPLITYFWHTRKTTVIGTPPNTASAENRPQSFSCS
jgi:hypothetical protein